MDAVCVRKAAWRSSFKGFGRGGWVGSSVPLFDIRFRYQRRLLVWFRISRRSPASPAGAARTSRRGGNQPAAGWEFPEAFALWPPEPG